MLNRLSQIYQARQDRMTRLFQNEESPSASENGAEIISEPVDQRALPTASASQDVEPKTEFEPAEKQRHFGILHYTMNNRFKKIMLVGLANVLIVLVFFLLIFFLMMRYRCETPDISVCTSTTSVPYSTSAPVSTKEPLKFTYCTNNFQLVGQKCWRIFAKVPPRDTAEATCRSYGSVLFSIDSAAQNQAFSSFMDNQHHRTWMGLLCNTADKSTCQWDSLNKWPFGYSAFAEGSPSGTTECIYYNVSDSMGTPWTSGDCTLGLSFACELPPTLNSDCVYNYKGNCYTYIDNAVTFSEAQDYCRSKCGNLVSIESYLEYVFLSSIVEAQGKLIWLGGISVNRNLIYWIDGSTTNYNNLRTFNGKRTCLVMDMANSGAWSTVECASKYNFICKVQIDGDCTFG